MAKKAPPSRFSSEGGVDLDGANAVVHRRVTWRVAYLRWPKNPEGARSPRQIEGHKDVPFLRDPVGCCFTLYSV